MGLLRLPGGAHAAIARGGRERSEREWRTLLEAAGFILTGVYPVGGDNLMVRNVGILEAKPA